LAVATVGAAVLVCTAPAQSIGEQIMKSAKGAPSRDVLGETGTLLLGLRKGDTLMYDVTSEYRTDHADGSGFSINRYSTELVFSVTEESEAGIVLMWHDLTFDEKVPVIKGGSVSVGWDGRLLHLGSSDWQFVLKFVVPMTLPPLGSRWSDEFRVAFATSAGAFGHATGKAFEKNTGGRPMTIALYGRDAKTRMDWEIHCVFERRVGVVRSVQFENLVDGTKSYMEWKSLHRPSKPIPHPLTGR
jgi:hypothetical protein